MTRYVSTLSRIPHVNGKQTGKVFFFLPPTTAHLNTKNSYTRCNGELYVCIRYAYIPSISSAAETLGIHNMSEVVRRTGCSDRSASRSCVVRLSSLERVAFLVVQIRISGPGRGGFITLGWWWRRGPTLRVMTVAAKQFEGNPRHSHPIHNRVFNWHLNSS